MGKTKRMKETNTTKAVKNEKTLRRQTFVNVSISALTDFTATTEPGKAPRGSSKKINTSTTDIAGISNIYCNHL